MAARVARLAALATSVPPYELRQDALMTHAAKLLPGVDADVLARMLPVYENAGIETRYSCVPLEWYERPHGWAEKNRLYLDNAVTLSAAAAEDALDRAGLGASEVDTIVAVSTTGIATPSLDALLMERMAFRRNTERLPVFGLGCAGGVLGLTRAAALARADPGKTVLLVVVELCGLTFRRNDASKANMVATALFGDGAAAAVITCSGDGPMIQHSGEHTWPDTLDVMGWRVADDGLAVQFSRDIPAMTRTEFRDAVLGFLAERNLALGDIDHFVCHPGGAKVLDALEEAFGVTPGGLTASRAVLNDYGNMSAASVLFVLERVLRQGAHGRMLLSSLGPGFTAAFLIMTAS
jgi:alkylresorcinol/alkylpyrone synthase